MTREPKPLGGMPKSGAFSSAWRWKWTAAVLGLAAMCLGAQLLLRGSTLVVDGDTLMVGSQRVRLWGVDAPEGLQSCKDARGVAFACGDRARDRLRALIGGAMVTCAPKDRDQYGRTVALCRAGDVDLGGQLVREGWALDYRQFSQGYYASQEAAARAERVGIWAGAFEPPSEFRRHERSAAVTPSVSGSRPSTPAGCSIKGNISRSGARIYHVPGDRDYAATRISEARGERWFCSETEAVAAGWRRAR